MEDGFAPQGAPEERAGVLVDVPGRAQDEAVAVQAVQVSIVLWGGHAEMQVPRSGKASLTNDPAAA